MDSRIALVSGTVLTLKNKDGGAILYTIHNEIGRGGSCIVYEASYETNAGFTKYVRIKECYPFKLQILREASGELLPSEQDAEMYQKIQAKTWEDFVVSSNLFYKRMLSDAFVNTLDVYKANNTTYIVSTFSPENTLKAYHPENITDCISLVKQVAMAINDIHKEGYLYLDIKPENVLVVQGHQNRVLLFDFDSLVPLGDCREQEDDERVSYTKGFAAIELQMAKRNRLGTYTDVYGVGALLFYLLFNRVPAAPDCEGDVEYNYSLAKYQTKNYNDKLFVSLSEFFHKTLANYYKDRIQNMEEVVGLLSSMEELSSMTAPFLCSTHINRPKSCFGRNEEIEKIVEWTHNDSSNCLAVTGMGGIGKSTIVREYVFQHRAEFDSVFYIHYQQDIEKTITNDYSLRINAVSKNEVESINDYFTRKLGYIKALLHDKKALLVIDNYSGGNTNELIPLLELPWKIIVVTRTMPITEFFDKIEISAISDQQSLVRLYEVNSGKELADDDRCCFEALTDCIQGHTLALELISKQIANSHLQIRDAVQLANLHGFSNIAEEKVQYSRDYSTELKTVKEVINAIVEAEDLSAQKKSILKVTSLFENHPIDVAVIKESMQLTSIDAVNELIHDGWIEVVESNITMHPVIQEVVGQWLWDEQSIKKITLMMKSFAMQLEKAEKSKKDRLITLSDCILCHVLEAPKINTLESFTQLMYQVVINASRHKEELIVRYGMTLINMRKLNENTFLSKVLNRVVEVYEEYRDFDKAYELLELAEKNALVSGSQLVKAEYYDALSDYYDHCLDGGYQTGNKKEEKLLRNMLLAMDKAIKYARRSRQEGFALLVKNLLGKAAVLIRATPGSHKRIMKLVKEAQIVLNTMQENKADLEAQCLMVFSWYYTLSVPYYEKAEETMALARNITEDSADTTLDLIDNWFIPAANICLYHGQFKNASRLLSQAIALCDNYDGVIPYRRKKIELLHCSLDVAVKGQNISQGMILLEEIDRLNEEYCQLGIHLPVDNDVRELLKKASNV